MRSSQEVRRSAEYNDMLRYMFKSKIHRVRVTESNKDYEGSLTIDSELLEAADILPNEEIHVWNITRGTRITTYALQGERGSGQVCVNGAGAHLFQPEDLVIIATFTQMDDAQARIHEPLIVLVDDRNRIRVVRKAGNGPQP